MNKKLTKTAIILSVIFGLFCSINSNSYCNAASTTSKPANQKISTIPSVSKKPVCTINKSLYTKVNSLDVVNNPKAYMGKKIKINATFDKFSTLGLDYKPAFKDSKDYISFLIKRDDVTDHTVPLSEMKIFLKRKEAEKFIDLESGDKIEIYGNVFSTALGDPWVETDCLIVLTPKKILKNSCY